MNTRSFLLAAVISGVLIGVLGNVPLLNLINCLLCIWVWLGGILAVYLYGRYQHSEPGLSVGQAAGLGAVAGIIGAVVGLPVNLLTGGITRSVFSIVGNAFQGGSGGGMPFPQGGLAPTLGFAFVVLLVDLVLYTIFGAAGAMIAASLFWKKPQVIPAPPPPAATPGQQGTD